MKLTKAIVLSVLFFTLIFGGGFLLAKNHFQSNSNLNFEPEEPIKQEKQIEEILPEINSKILNVLPLIRNQADSEVLLFAVGDIMLSRSVESLMKKNNDWLLPFKLTKEISSKADIAFGNLETSIYPGRLIQTGEFAFRVDPQAVSGLTDSGFDVFSLANNHTPNFGQAGLKQTFKELDEAKIKYVGAGKDHAEASRPIIIERKGLKFGFLAYTYSLYVSPSYFAQENFAGTNPMNSEKMKADVAALKPLVDYVIVSMHAGTEYEPEPNLEQEKFAKAAIEAGANLVLGSHPHVVQTMEKYQDGYIFYSLGNFVFDQMWSEQTRQGLGLNIIFSKEKIKKIELLPIYINKNFQPAMAEGKNAKEILDRLQFNYSEVSQLNYSNQDFLIKNTPIILASDSDYQTNYQSFDFDSDGQNEEAIVFEKTGYLIKKNKVIWKTDSSWEVENVLVGDFNNDKKIELGFSLWKEGSYGPAKPFWVKDNDSEISNHLFLYQFENNEVKMIWGSSALDYPIKEMILKDFDSDNLFDLVVWQGECGKLEKNCEKKSLGVWRWNKFGFYNIFQSPILSAYEIK